MFMKCISTSANMSNIFQVNKRYSYSYNGEVVVVNNGGYISVELFKHGNIWKNISEGVIFVEASNDF